MKKIYFLAAALILATACAASFGAAVTARADGRLPKFKAGLMMDAATGTVVFEHNADERLPIASMVKIMTLLLCFEALDAGDIALDGEVVVSQNAASMGGSQAFLDANCAYKTEELLKSIVVASANDSCVAMAEHICGSAESFTDRMNKRAAELGMENTYFVNCTGLPAPNQYCSARDAATMMRELIRHDKFFEYAGIWMFDFVHPSGRITQLTNTNKLVRFYEGCDGGKTGFTSEALSCLTATAKRGDTRFIAAVIGAPDSRTRNAEMSRLFNEGFGKYATTKVIDRNEPLDPVPVEGGKADSVPVAFRDDFCLFGEKSVRQEITRTYEIAPVKAPVRAGDVVGRVVLSAPDGTVMGETDIVATDSVGRMNYGDIVDDFIGRW